MERPGEGYKGGGGGQAVLAHQYRHAWAFLNGTAIAALMAGNLNLGLSAALGAIAFDVAQEHTVYAACTYVNYGHL